MFCEIHPREKWDGREGFLIEFLGDYEVAACSECRNAYHEFVTAKEDPTGFLRIREIEISLEAIKVATATTARLSGDAENLAENYANLLSEKNRLELAAYGHSKKWVEARRARLAAEAEKTEEKP